MIAQLGKKWRSVAVAATLAFLVGACEHNQSSLHVGQPAPSVRTKTLNDVGGDFSRITSYRYPDARMYQVSIDDALKSGKPVVLEFATPGHCTVCDVQLQMLKGLLAKYENQVIFIHMDQYQNPEAFTAFRVMGDPWTFVIDGQSTVRFRQAGRMLYGELDAVIRDTLALSVADSGNP